MVDIVVSKEPIAAAATLVADALRSIPGTSPRLAVAGGSVLTALAPLVELLTPKRWQALRLTWVDERCVPFADSDSNRGQAWKKVPALKRELPLYLDNETPEGACARVTERLTAEFDSALDVLLLGMGEDGHIASLFPGGSWSRGTDLVLPVLDSPKPPPQRITLTLPLLCTASHAVLLAVGATKWPAIERLLAGDPALPASALPHLTLVTDQAF